MKQVDATVKKIYGPINRCIYCRKHASQGENFSSEHIIPYGLGGNVEAEGGVCPKCKLAWEMTDRLNLKTHFADIRFQLNVQSRSKKDKRKRHTIPVDVGITTDFGSRLTKNEAERLAIPNNLMLPRFMPPGIITGYKRRQGSEYIPNFWHLVEGKQNHVGKSVQFHQKWNFYVFQNFLMKTAHGLAIAVYGFEKFVPYLYYCIHPNMMEHRLSFIGGFMKLDPPQEERHTLSLVRQKVGNVELLLAQIRLFADFGSPTYLVVVGHTIPHLWY